MEMEIIEKLQNNFQNIVNDIDSRYEVIITHRHTKAAKTLREKTRLKPSDTTIKYIIAAACEYIKLDEDKFYGKVKYSSDITADRIKIVNVLIELKFYVHSMSNFAKFINKDHSSMTYYKKKHNDYMSYDTSYVHSYNQLKNYILTLISF